MFRTLPAIKGLAATAVAACLSGFDAGAATQTTDREVDFKVFAEYYVLADRVIDDLDVLEKSVIALRPHNVKLAVCGSGAERALRAAAHRFRDLRWGVWPLAADSPACRAAGVARMQPAAHRSGLRPYGIDDAAVDRWWRELMDALTP